jgi:hypothetical protein
MERSMKKSAVLRWSVAGLACVAVLALAVPAGAREWKIYESKKYGFKMKVPAEFTVDSDDKGVTMHYQPGSAPSGSDESSSKKKKRKFGVNIRGIGFNTEQSEESSSSGSSSGGGLDTALGIYVNWTWMPDVAPGTLYSANKDSTQQNIDSPDPDYTDIQVFDKKKGYAYEGNTYWYKEVTTGDPEEIHRWHIYSAGNKSAYIVGLTGVERQFSEWGPVYEEVVKSFELIPMEK